MTAGIRRQRYPAKIFTLGHVRTAGYFLIRLQTRWRCDPFSGIHWCIAPLRQPPPRHKPSLSTSSVPPPAMDSIRNNTDLLAAPGTLESPSSASSEPVFHDIIRQSPLTIHLPSQSPIVKITVISPGASPWPTLVPEQDTVAITAESSTEDAPSGDKDAIDPTSENRGGQTDTNAILDLSSHASEPPPLPLTPDIAAISPSQP